MFCFQYVKMLDKKDDKYLLNLGTGLEFDVKVIYYLLVSNDNSVVFSHLALWATFFQSGKAVGVDL
jgi:hypothetical protein